MAEYSFSPCTQNILTGRFITDSISGSPTWKKLVLQVNPSQLSSEFNFSASIGNEWFGESGETHSLLVIGGVGGCGGCTFLQIPKGCTNCTIRNLSGQLNAQVIQFSTVYGAYVTLLGISDIVNFVTGLASPNCNSQSLNLTLAVWRDVLGTIYAINPNGNFIAYPTGTAVTMASLALSGTVQVTDPLASQVEIQIATDIQFNNVILDQMVSVTGQTTSFTGTISQFGNVYFRYRLKGSGLLSNWCNQGEIIGQCGTGNAIYVCGNNNNNNNNGGTLIIIQSPGQYDVKQNLMPNFAFSTQTAKQVISSGIQIGQLQPQGYQMPTINFNNNILAAARRLHDQRDDPTQNGDVVNNNTLRYNSAILTEYENRAVRDLFKDKFLQLQEKVAGLFPEYLRTSGSLNLTPGSGWASVPYPSDAWYPTDVSFANYTGHFYRVPDQEVENVKNNNNFMIVPSVNKPVWWPENNQICVLPATLNSAIIAKYIHYHTDIQPITGMSSAGDLLSSGNPSYTATTKTLTGGTYLHGFTSTDVNKAVMFYDGTNVYFAQIQSVVNSNTITLYGYGLPTTNVTVVNVIKADYLSSPPDLQLNPSWFGEIIDRMVQFGLQDAANGIV